MGEGGFNPATLRILPAGPKLWAPMAELFDSVGDARGCYCAYLYRSNADFRANLKTGGNKAWMKAQLDDGLEPGILAMDGDRVAGWCGISPRRYQSRLARSRVLAAVDEEEVWSLTCLLVGKDWRRQGMMRVLVQAALEFAKNRGAQIIEAYPVVNQGRGYPGELFTGTYQCYLDCGFEEVLRRSDRRPIMRYTL